MERHSLSNCRHAERNIGVLLVVMLALSACASNGDGHALPERWPSGADTAAQYLLALREHLALAPDERAIARQRLRTAAAGGGAGPALEYAFALSVSEEDRASLEAAQMHFERLLAAPEPLPIALDALVRLQLRQVLDRLARMRTSGEIHAAYRASANGQQMCLAELEDATRTRAELAADLAETRRKLKALARIEQTVNENQPNDNIRRDRETENGDDNAKPPDTAGR